MFGRNYSHSGMGHGTYNDIEAGSTFEMSGMGQVWINGTIGAGATIEMSGMGNLAINGRVCENVRIILSGMGNITFAQRPPQSVLNQIEKPGLGNITVPGGYAPQQAAAARPANNFNFGGMQFSNVSFGNNVFVGNNDSDNDNYNVGPSNVSLGNGVSIVSANGQVKVTKNGVTTTYMGNNASMLGNRLFIDSREVGPRDAVPSQAALQHNNGNARGSNSFDIMGMLGGLGRFNAAAASAPSPVIYQRPSQPYFNPAPAAPAVANDNRDLLSDREAQLAADQAASCNAPAPGGPSFR